VWAQWDFQFDLDRRRSLPNTAEEFTAALRLLIDSVEYRRTLGVQARRMIEEKFGWQTLAREFLGVIEEAAVSR
jgi:glycosyltransferase involved in cell wall biosynthesis